MIEKVYLARPRGFCAGVVMAIQAVEKAAEKLRSQGPLVVYHDIVHNDVVVNRLRESHGVHFVEDLAEIDGLERDGSVADTVVFSAHGVAPAVRREAASRGLFQIDATCPLVTKVHIEARKFAARGFTILLIGDSAEHQEVKGTYGEAPEQTILISVHTMIGKDPHMADPYTVVIEDSSKLVALTQTTLNVDDTMETVRILKKRYPDLVVPPKDDLCYATKNRQEAVKAVADECDFFLVLTSAHSSNGQRLLELTRDLVGRAEGIDTVDEIEGSWLDGVRTIGITSAASTPEHLVIGVLDFLKNLNPDLEVVEHGEWENIEFRQPKRVAPQDIRV